MVLARVYRLFRHVGGSSITLTSPENAYSTNKMISAYFKRGDVESARRLFVEMSQRNVVSYNCMISGFSRNGMVREAREVFDSIPNENLVSWTAMMSAYIGCGNLVEARNLFDHMPQKLKNVVCWDVMLNGYVKNGSIRKAKELFDEAPEKNIGLYNRMLRGYVRMGCVEEAYEMFMSMPERDVVSWTNIIACLSQAGLIEKAKRLFEEIPFEKDLKAWTIMIQGFMDNNMVAEAYSLFQEMPNRDVVAWNCMIYGLVQNGKLKEAIDFYEKMPTRNIVSSNSILYGLVQEGDLIGAQRFFETDMPLKDSVSWNTLISGYQTEQALLVYTQMLKHGFRPDKATFTSVISVCGSVALQNWGRAIHLSVIKMGYEHSTMVTSSLLSMYSKCGQIRDSATLFEAIKERDVVAWNAMIVAESYHGSPNKAMQIFSSMIEAGNDPNHITFLSILTMCAHWGLVQDGQRYFSCMKQDWNISPEPEHYACMVDLLGRSGLLIEAYDLVKDLPVDLPVHAWEALLYCCKLHEDSELGELVMSKIAAMNPLNPEMSVLLFNTYASKGLWNKASKVRLTMKKLNLKKEAGRSWIEMGNTGGNYSTNYCLP